jgi:enamine deaminase RidA (YjgF/YER057c/UK114 family)
VDIAASLQRLRGRGYSRDGNSSILCGDAAGVRRLSMRGSRISSGSVWEERAGYARAVVLPTGGGRWLLVSGTTGYDYATGAISDDPEVQTRQCFANISAALAAEVEIEATAFLPG